MDTRIWILLIQMIYLFSLFSHIIVNMIQVTLTSIKLLKLRLKYENTDCPVPAWYCEESQHFSDKWQMGLLCFPDPRSGY